MAFTTADGDDDVRDGPEDEDNATDPNKKSKLCGQFRDSTCPYKHRHTWKECPRNKWSINFGKELDPTTGDIILCQLAEFEEALSDGDDLVFVDSVKNTS